MQKLRVALIGQSQFGADVFKLLLKEGHEIVGVFTIPDQNGKPDVLAATAEKMGAQVFKMKAWRQKGAVLPEVFEKYKSVNADVNVLAFCSQFIPMEVINYPTHQSICYHPSILPRHRGASAINWTLMQGDKKAGFAIFWPDDGLDTGPILLMEETRVDPNDTLDSLYNRFLYPAGVKAMAKAVRLIAEGKAPKIKQPEEGATYDAMIKKDNVKIDWSQTAEAIHNFIRGNDKVPGAWTLLSGKRVTLFGSTVWSKNFFPSALRKVKVDDAPQTTPEAIVHRTGMLFFGSDGKAVNIRQVVLEDGTMMNACDYGRTDLKQERLELTDIDRAMEAKIRSIWISILGTDKIEADSSFFKLGAGSMDVVRLAEEINFNVPNVKMTNDDIYMNGQFDQLIQAIIRRQRGLERKVEFKYDAVTMNVNNMELKFPHQIFINNEFVDAISGKTYKTINPTDESVICEIAFGGKEDAELAVDAAEEALRGPWGLMNARDRGTLMYRLAELMEANKEELATLESMDSGAVYTLALKTHVGMSIDTFRYFAGWCDKIQGKTIPINNARPNSNLTFTKREPVGVCGIVIPWNYPLMMLAWKLGACIAAGNAVVLKPAQVTPLTALKFAELVVKAGFPPGVINIIPGSGSQVGQAIADHPRVRKLGFTGSTEIGKTIMKSCAASNLKKVSLELGGKSPLIIFNDADMEKAVRMAMGGVFFNKGENCIAAGRLFVEESIHDEFVERVIVELKKMKIGNPLDRSTDHGPQNHRAHLEKLVEYCQRGEKEGAKLVYGGKQVERPGLFFYPTVFTEVEDDNYIASEESFGPVMIISKFPDGDLDGVIRRANLTEFGLASGVFTRDISKALQVADRLQAGTVFVNCYNKTDVAAPFGGFKQSGFGKDLGEEALNEYLRTKCVTVEY